MKIDFGTHYNINKYCNLDEGIEEVCPELKKDVEIKMLCDKLHWARYNLKKKLEDLLEDGSVE